jgi:chromatin assembly factor 1 subunit A
MCSTVVTGRRPLGKDPQLDYEVDSDDEWEEEPEGENLSVRFHLILLKRCMLACCRHQVAGSIAMYSYKGARTGSMCDVQESDMEDEEEDMEEEDDGFVVPNGYMSEDEGISSVQQDLDDLCADLDGEQFWAC